MSLGRPTCQACRGVRGAALSWSRRTGLRHDAAVTTILRRENLQPLSLQPPSLQPLGMHPLSLQPLDLQPLDLQPLRLHTAPWHTAPQPYMGHRKTGHNRLPSRSASMQELCVPQMLLQAIMQIQIKAPTHQKKTPTLPQRRPPNSWIVSQTPDSSTPSTSHNH